VKSWTLLYIIGDAYKYMLAQRVLELAVDLEWQKYTLSERRDKWAMLLVTIGELDKYYPGRPE
jgi:hypothetical protein